MLQIKIEYLQIYFSLQNDELKKLVKKILDGANLEQVTMKTVVKQVISYLEGVFKCTQLILLYINGPYI